MNSDDLKAIVEMMNTEPGDTLARFLIDQNAQNITQAAYHQGMADAFKLVHSVVSGDVKFEGETPETSE